MVVTPTISDLTIDAKKEKNEEKRKEKKITWIVSAINPATFPEVPKSMWSCKSLA